jgi:hypothetical protein
MMSSKISLGIATALGVLLLATASATAQAPLWLEPADTAHPVLGPRKAEGAVIWSHGRTIDAEDYEAETPPYIAVLGAAGWDAFRFNRERAYDKLPVSARMLAAEVHRLKLEGYRQVALAGQSFGAFLSLMTADASDEVDAVIATAPAAYGSFADFYDTWRLNATRLYPLLEQLRHARVMLFYFHGDDFDPGGRAERSEDILSARRLPFIVVDQPPRLTSHWAAGGQDFADLFGRCIREFLEAPTLGDGARCDEGGLVAGTGADPSDRPVATAKASPRPLALAGSH